MNVEEIRGGGVFRPTQTVYHYNGCGCRIQKSFIVFPRIVWAIILNSVCVCVCVCVGRGAVVLGGWGGGGGTGGVVKI